MATYNLISSQTLATSAASVTFSSIPQTYTDLVLKVSARSDTAITYDYLGYYINGLTTSIYSGTYLRGYSTSTDSGRASNQTFGGSFIVMEGNTATSNIFSNNELYIPNYTSSNNKIISAFSVSENNASTNAQATIEADLIRTTAAITSLTLNLYASGSNFLSGSTFYLYGIRSS